MSLDGLGDVLDSRIAKQTYQTNASFSCSAEARKTVLLIPALVGPWSPGVSQVDPADLDPAASENSNGSLTLVFFLNWDRLLCHRKDCFGKTCYAIEADIGRLNPLPLINRETGSGNGQSGLVL